MTARLPFLTWSAVEQKQAVMTAAWLSKFSNKRHAAIQARAAHCTGHTLDCTIPMVFYVCSAADIAPLCRSKTGLAPTYLQLAQVLEL